MCIRESAWVVTVVYPGGLLDSAANAADIVRRADSARIIAVFHNRVFHSRIARVIQRVAADSAGNTQLRKNGPGIVAVADGPIVAARNAARPLGRGAYLAGMVAVFNKPEVVAAHGPGPVSYTHLDVYKRQTIIIAQRVASVSDADRIIVLSDGRIDAVGTHAELLETNEIYREVYESQRKGVA